MLFTTPPPQVRKVLSTAHQLGHGHDAPVVHDRDAEDRPRFVPRLQIHFAVEPRVCVGVLQIDDVLRSGHMPRQPRTERQAKHEPVVQVRLQLRLVPRVVHEEEAAAVRVRQVLRVADDRERQFGLVQRRGRDQMGQVQHHLRLAVLELREAVQPRVPQRDPGEGAEGLEGLLVLIGEGDDLILLVFLVDQLRWRGGASGGRVRAVVRMPEQRFL